VRISWKKYYHEILKKAQVELSLESTRNHADWVMVFIASFVLLVLYDLFALDFHFCLCLVHGHATLFVVLYCISFHGFFLFSSWSCLLCFEGLGNQFGKEES